MPQLKDFQLSPPEGGAPLEALMERAERDGSVLGEDLLFRSRQGRLFHADVHVARDPRKTTEASAGFTVTLAERPEARVPELVGSPLLDCFYSLHFLALATLSPDECQWTGVNDRLLEILGYSREQLLGMTWQAVSPNKDHDNDQQHFSLLATGDCERFSCDKAFIRADGEVVRASVSVRAVRRDDGRPWAYFVVLRDIGQDGADLYAQKRLQHLQDMTIRVNQAIVRSHDCKTLVNTFCSILVQQGMFSAAWIGVWEGGDNRKLRLFALCGDDVGDIEPHKCSAEWLRKGEDSGRDNVPYMVVNELSPEEGEAHGAAEAFAAGMRSLAGFAITSGDTVTGTLNLFSTESHAFTAKTVFLLREMVHDLSVAMERLQAMAVLKAANRVVESSAVILCRWLAEPGWPVDYISANVSRWGYSAAEMMSGEKLFIQLVHPDDRERLIAEMGRHIRRKHKQFRQQYRIVTGTGKTLWIEDHSSIEYDPRGNMVRFEGALTDITDRKRHEQREAGRNRVLSLLAGGAELSVILDSLARSVELEDPEVLCDITLVDEGRHRLVPGAAPSLDADFQQAVSEQSGKDILGPGALLINKRQVIISADIQSDPRWADYRDLALARGLASCWSVPVLSSQGDVLGSFNLFHRRIHTPSESEIRSMREFANLAAIAIERTQNLQTLEESAERWHFALEAAGDAVFDWNVQADTLIQSRRCGEMLGYADHEFACSRAKDWFRRVHPDDLHHARELLDRHLEGNSPHYETEHRVRGKDGGWRWILARGLVVRRDSKGSPLRMVGTISDITDRKRMEQELREMATTDHLTGLSNRRHFLDRMQDEILRMDRNPDHQAAVMMLDLDHFKHVNDTHGHSTGDTVLRHFASLVRYCLRKSDFAGRMGGEEFAVLLPDTDLQDAIALAERLRKRIARIPVRTEDLEISITVSIGITCLSSRDILPDHALQRADEALYRAKTSGRNRIDVAKVAPASGTP
ncbi:diguanylate cyclase [Ectothiorhodospira lacustris]|uniref:diguanylate cyclase n=1 Tax=Ectothiorhodospira lacustris TaxID=2899127 RepID=UPI001EE85514|nr:diguanylate cyclase [Ectothiorhodospira lacustris]MCG5501227.1 diguanylate cyclase [Ectothiorhodospira lacustris]MCG5511013.1 diguanylate cyclase [Ectothiorhodospira lacustris]MCG5522743.1 diguanylate cyclase [Ectothiorhodospira lacustris]